MGSSEDSRGGRDHLHGFRRDLRARRSSRSPSAGSPLVRHGAVPTPDLAATWTAIQGELRAAVTDSTYHLWLEPLRLEAVDGPKLLVGAPDGMRTWVADRYARVLEACAPPVVGPRAEVELVALGPGAETTPPPPVRAEAPAQGHEASASLDLNPKYTFEQFVI